MHAAGAGWFEGEAPSAMPGDDYALVLDGRDPLPDPRTQLQPAGVSGPSRLVDHDRHVWRIHRWDLKPLRDAIIYELHIGTFSESATFEGAIQHLPHLKQLGITHVELMPVNEFSGARGWGYDSVEIFAPHHAYGGPEGLKRLIDECHAQGLGVIADVVYNHFGPVGNYLEQFGPYLTDRHSTPWGKAINLDGPASDEVRGYLCDHAATMFREYRFDGLRLDAVHAIFDMSAVHFLEQLSEEKRRLEAELDRPLLLIAESDLNDPRLIRDVAAGGYGLDAQWSDDFHHALHTVLTGERNGYYADFGKIEDLAKAIRNAFVFDGQYSSFRERRHGRSASGLKADKFIGYLQNHDQIGNRACGDRIGHLVDIAYLKIGAAIVMMAPFVPLIFQGEEWAASTPFLYFADHQDPALGNAVREGRRREFAAFGWRLEDIPDPQAPQTFVRSKLSWDELSRSPHREVLEWYRELIRLRRENATLRSGRFEDVRVRFDESQRWLVIERGEVSILCNFAREARTLPCSAKNVLLASHSIAEPSNHRLRMPPASVAVLSG
jgi:maltooligosyltrehalose trehalohydrolase